jgi:hypothetical protein
MEVSKSSGVKLQQFEMPPIAPAGMFKSYAKK